jgi:hypothetical protein
MLQPAQGCGVAVEDRLRNKQLMASLLTCKKVTACWLVMQSHSPSHASTMKSAMPSCSASGLPAEAKGNHRDALGMGQMH